MASYLKTPRPAVPPGISSEKKFEEAIRCMGAQSDAVRGKGSPV